MLRWKNGEWVNEPLMKLNLQQFAEPAGDAGTEGGDAGAGDAGGAEAAGNESENAGNQPESNQDGNTSPEVQSAEIARLKAEIAKQKAALDKATHEAAENKRALKAKMTAEEIAAQEKAAAEEAQKQRIIELEKQVAKTSTVKTVMGKLGLDEESAGNLADHLYGAADIENALLEIQKAWQSREAAIRKEFGKVTAPGAGADSNSPEAQAIKRAQELGKSRNALNERAQNALNAYIR